MEFEVAEIEMYDPDDPRFGPELPWERIALWVEIPQL